MTGAVEARRSQICLGLDPDPAAEPWSSAAGPKRASSPRARRELVADAVADRAEELIASAGPSCVAIKPQLARFEALGAPGWGALERICGFAQDQGLLVVADGKRGDVPVSAAAYAAALLGQTDSGWGPIEGLGADALTVNPLMGRDSLEPLVDLAEQRGAGLFVLVRTSNGGAADLLDLELADGGPLHERIARLTDSFAGRLAGRDPRPSGMGAVVGATRPAYIARLRELMPAAIFLLPGVGAQGGDPADLGPAFLPGPASALVTASRSLVGDPDPAAAAERLRATVWDVAGAAPGAGRNPAP